MVRMTVDSNLRNTFGDFKHPVELCDETGKLLARLLPVLDADLQAIVPPLSSEELDRRRKEPRLSTEQVLEQLK